MSAPRTQEAPSTEQFSETIAPLLDALRERFEAEDAALLAMHPGAPDDHLSQGESA